MNNTANGGREAKRYTKNGETVYVRFNVVNNRRTQTTYINLWDGETKIGQTYDVHYGDKAEAMKRAAKILVDSGYVKI